MTLTQEKARILAQDVRTLAELIATSPSPAGLAPAIVTAIGHLEVLRGEVAMFERLVAEREVDRLVVREQCYHAVRGGLTKTDAENAARHHPDMRAFEKETAAVKHHRDSLRAQAEAVRLYIVAATQLLNHTPALREASDA